MGNLTEKASGNCSHCRRPLPPGANPLRRYCTLRCRERAHAQRRQDKGGRSPGRCDICGERTARLNAILCRDCRLTLKAADKQARREKLERLWAAGLPVADIAKEFGISAEGMQSRIKLERAEGANLPRRQRRKIRTTLGPKRWVRERTAKAVARGEIDRPGACDRCGIEGVPQAHHRSYNKPDSYLDVEWLCQSCHTEEHNPQREVA